MSELYIGLMSGTSVDGIDAALVKFKDDKIELIAFEYLHFSNSIRKKIQDISQPDSLVTINAYGSLDSHLGNLFAQAISNLLGKANVSIANIIAIGSHGQTVCHAPESSPPFSLQVGDPNIIAEKTGITTITDFRRRDIAANGQGAPLVPAFHKAVFSQVFDLSKQNISIINIGGITNITYLSHNKTTGFDIGPGNALIDYWIQKHRNTDYDNNGSWAKTGKINIDFVNHLKQDSYFKLAPPKSTGKEYFSPSWLNKQTKAFSSLAPEDIQASLCKFTADIISESITQHAPLTELTLICGGGIHNSYLLELISNNISHPVSSTASYGINPDHVEAMAFAWLARQTIKGLTGNLVEVTGAKSPVILGGIYPGKKGLN